MRAIQILAYIFFITFYSFAQAQVVQLKIQGSCSFVPEKIGQTIQLKIIVNKNKCDPEKGFFNMEERLVVFSDALRAEGVNFNRFKSSFESSRTNVEEIEILSYSGSKKEIEKVVDVARRLEIQIVSLNFDYSSRNLEEQDQSAICALKDAKNKAEKIAKELGLKNCVLRAIDDDTSGTRSLSLDLLLNRLSRDAILSGASTYSIFGYFELY